jgi:hypothetical protein
VCPRNAGVRIEGSDCVPWLIRVRWSFSLSEDENAGSIDPQLAGIAF